MNEKDDLIRIFEQIKTEFSKVKPQKENIVKVEWFEKVDTEKVPVNEFLKEDVKKINYVLKNIHSEGKTIIWTECLCDEVNRIQHNIEMKANIVINYCNEIIEEIIKGKNISVLQLMKFMFTNITLNSIYRDLEVMFEIRLEFGRFEPKFKEIRYCVEINDKGEEKSVSKGLFDKIEEIMNDLDRDYGWIEDLDIYDD